MDRSNTASPFRFCAGSTRARDFNADHTGPLIEAPIARTSGENAADRAAPRASSSGAPTFDFAVPTATISEGYGVFSPVQPPSPKLGFEFPTQNQDADLTNGSPQLPQPHHGQQDPMRILSSLRVTDAREAVRLWTRLMLDGILHYRSLFPTGAATWESTFADWHFLSLTSEIIDGMPRIMAWGADMPAIQQGVEWECHKGRLMAKHLREFGLDSVEMEMAYQFFKVAVVEAGKGGEGTEEGVKEVMEEAREVLRVPYQVWCAGGRRMGVLR